MSLIHWWPLNGDLKDYGINNTSLTSDGPTINDSGKIGKCYYFNQNQYLYASSVDVGDEFSVCYWVKYTDLTYPKTHVGVQHSAGAYTSTNKGWDIGHGPSGGGALDFDINDGTRSQRMSFTASNISELNVWKHFALVCSLSAKTVKLYINGTLVGTNNINSSMTSFKTNRQLTIGGLYGWSLKGYLNDFRIYDTPISAKEVKEISKGLVLHYDFNDPYVEGTTNYGVMKDSISVISGLESDWKVEKLDRYTVKVTALKSNPSYSTYGDIVGTLTGTKYVQAGVACTLSCEIVDYKGSLSRIYPCSGGFGSIVGFGTFMGRVYRTIIHTSNWTHNIGIRTSQQTNIVAGDYLTFRYTQIEEKDHPTPYVNGTRSAGTVFDCSGYNNNAIQWGNSQVVQDSTSGKYSIKFDGASAIRTSDFYLGNEWSYGCWLKSASSSRSWEGVIIQNTNGGDADMQLGLYTYPTGGVIQSTANGQYNSSISYTYDNTWKHFFATFDGTNLKTYINGQLVNTKSITNALLSRHTVTIGARYRGSSYDCYFLGNVNDVKIYATVLSASDILAEYNRKASIDKNGNLFTSEFEVDNSTNIKVTKAALIKCNNIVEGTSLVKFLEGYTQLEYLESSGTQWIDSNYIPNYNTVITGTFMNTETVEDTPLFGVRKSDMSNSYTFWAHPSDHTNTSWYSGFVFNGTQVNFSRNATKPHNNTNTFYFSKSICLINTESKTVSSSSGSPNISMAIFGLKNGNNIDSRKFIGRIYDFVINENDNIIRNFIPAKRNSDNVLGLYDLANRTFYTNAGSGTFTAGPEISNISAVYAKEIKEI